MIRNEMETVFLELADTAIFETEALFPSDMLNRAALFIELTRAMDLAFVESLYFSQQRKLGAPERSLLSWGYNLAIEKLLPSLRIIKGFPLFESTQETRVFALNMLLKLGQYTLLRRVATMIRAGIVTAEESGDEIMVRGVDGAKAQLLDIIEFSKLRQMEKDFREGNTTAQGWQVEDMDAQEYVSHFPGAFHLHESYKEKDNWLHDNIGSVLEPLVRPWDSGRGIMVEYGASPEADDHFFTLAGLAGLRWRDEAGIHPKAQFNGYSGRDLISVTIAITALHLKHTELVLAALQKYPEVSPYQSFTIGGSKKELVESIAQYIGMNADLVGRVMDSLTLQPHQVSIMNNDTTPFIPLLFGANGHVIRPISSLIRNPLISVCSQLKAQNNNAVNVLSKDREDWMRSDIYALFRGNRYQCISGSIDLKDGARFLTDIDAVVFDKITGELALFQIKWQDYFTDDVKKICSRASNLTRAMDKWASVVEDWVLKNDSSKIAHALRMKLPKQRAITSIHIFGVSRTFGRVQGFGSKGVNSAIAISNWPHFVRIRNEVGPTKHVISKMHTAIKEASDASVEVEAEPFELIVSGKRIRLEDLWNKFEE